jgi:hypothetical protein
MEIYGAYCEYPKTTAEFLELPLGLYTREWNHTDFTDPTGTIQLDPGSRSFTLAPGQYYLVRGFSSVTMMSDLVPIIDTRKAYPGCCYVYDIQRWPKPPGPHDEEFDEFMKSLYAVGAGAVAMYGGASIFECVIHAPEGARTRIAVGHQVGYDPAHAVNKVYARVGGGDSTYHLAAKISIYKMP